MLQIIFFNLTIVSLSLSLSPPIFGNSIAAILFFLPFSTIPLPQISFSLSFFFLFQFGNLATTIPFFSSSNFRPQFLQLGCHNSFVFLQFSTTWLPQFLYSLSSFLPYNFNNLVATIAFFLSSASLIRALHLGSRNFGNLIIEIQILSHFSYHIISLVSLILFIRISATVLPKFTYFLIFPNNFQ